jgi:hypothetical protein
MVVQMVKEGEEDQVEQEVQVEQEEEVLEIPSR